MTKNKADKTWKIFGVNSYQEYCEKFVVPSKFHSQVNEDVIKAYEICKRHMENAWHHYPSYDEALKSLLTIFEMAIRIRSSAIGLDIAMRQRPSLAELIKALGKYGYDPLVDRMERIRAIRNVYAHPMRYGFAPPATARIIVPILNLINLIFLDTTKVQRDFEYLNRINANFQLIAGQTVGFIKNHKFQLVHSAKCIGAFTIGHANIAIWSIHPVIDGLSKLIADKRVLNSTTMATIQSNLVMANASFDPYSMSPASFCVTTDKHWPEKLRKYRLEWDQISQQDQLNFLSLHESESYREYEELQYKMRW